MSFTIKDLDEAVSRGWEVATHHWKTKEPYTYHAGGYHELLEGINWKGRTLELPGIGTVSLVEDHGGGEGSGEERWFVFRVLNDDGVRLFRRNGYYASFHGSDFDGPTEIVRPVEKTVTVYEAVAA